MDLARSNTHASDDLSVIRNRAPRTQSELSEVTPYYAQGRHFPSKDLRVKSQHLVLKVDPKGHDN